MLEVSLTAAGLALVLASWAVVRSMRPRGTEAPAAAILERRHAVRAELDSLLGEDEADRLLCEMARHENHPAFDLALMERALASAIALSGAGTATRPWRPAERNERGGVASRGTDGQIQIPLPRSLTGQAAVHTLARGAQHG